MHGIEGLRVTGFRVPCSVPTCGIDGRTHATLMHPECSFIIGHWNCQDIARKLNATACLTRIGFGRYILHHTVVRISVWGEYQDSAFLLSFARRPKNYYSMGAIMHCPSYLTWQAIDTGICKLHRILRNDVAEKFIFQELPGPTHLYTDMESPGKDCSLPAALNLHMSYIPNFLKRVISGII